MRAGLVVGVLVALVGAAPAAAHVTAVSGNVELVSAPADARSGQLESSTDAQTWDEAQDYTLASDLTIDSPSTFAASGTIPAGTVIDSHMIHADRNSGVSGTETYTGTVTFSTPVLGVILNTADLDQSDFLGASTLYSTVNRGSDHGSDTVSVSADATTVTFHTFGAVDEARVITQGDMPVIAGVGGPTAVKEGGQEAYTVTASDPNPSATLSYAWKVVSGNAQISGPATNPSVSVQFTDGPSTVVLEADVSDQGGNAATRTVTIDEANVAPTLGSLAVTGSGKTACQSGNRVTLGVTYSDPAGALDAPFVGTVGWGDGSAATPFSASPFSGALSYGPGTHTITVNVSDKDGGAAVAQTTAVSLLYAHSNLLPPVNADGSSVFKYGSTVPVKIRITDCAGKPVPGLRPEIGTSTSGSLASGDPIDETPSSTAADTTGRMRYDRCEGLYIYNFATRYLSNPNGTYWFYIRDPAVGQVTQKFAVRSH
jgi:hypothetical protein